MPYRVELASSARAGCQDAECKHDGVKIPKGDLRFGTWVTFKEHGSWKWKHWGCVTPLQVAHWKESSEDNPDLIDGLDELDEASRRKVLQAFEDEHVADEDWSHEPEYNVSGCKKRRPWAKNRATAANENVDKSDAASSPIAKKSKKRTHPESDAGSDVKPAKRASRTKKAKLEQDHNTDDAVPVATKKRPAARSKKVKDESVETDDDDGVVLEPTKRKAARSKKVKDEPIETDNGGDVVLEPTKRKAVRSKRLKEEPVDDDEERTAITAPAKRGRARAQKAKDEPDDEAVDAKPTIDPSRRGRVKRANKLAASVSDDNGEADQDEVQASDLSTKDDEEAPTGARKRRRC